MSIELIIARYNEELSWVKNVPSNIKVTIYNKGKNNISNSFIKLPNVGRESNTYLEHIMKNYDNLANITIFCQGDPFEHNPYFIKLLKNINKFQPIQPLSYFYNNDTPPREIKSIILKNKIDSIYVEYLNNNFIPCYPQYWYNYHTESIMNNLKKKI